MRQAWSKLLFAPVAMLLATTSAFDGQVILTADGHTEPYARIKSVLGAPVESPDCPHPAFDPHITQTKDDTIGRYVFIFNIHVVPDNDRCKGFDRQRLENQDGGVFAELCEGLLG